MKLIHKERILQQGFAFSYNVTLPKDPLSIIILPIICSILIETCTNRIYNWITTVLLYILGG